MSDTLKKYWIYGISFLFIGINTYLLANEHFWGIILPVLALLAVLYVFALDKVLYLVVFLTPIAINFTNFDARLGVSIPTEPLLFGVMIIFLLKMLYEQNYENRILRHPVTIAIIINLIWIFFTSITSEIPVVSFKYLVARLWFVIPLYFMGILLFREYKNIKIFPWLYVIPLMGVIVYATINHATFGFTKESAHWSMKPFYNDHTEYGAVISIFIPVFFGYILNPKHTLKKKLFSTLVTVVLLTALVLSNSRAAWLSVAAAIGVYFIILLRIKLRWVLLAAGVIIGLFFGFRYQIVEELEENKQDSSADLVEHVQSISNISSDASNLERINRWQSAIRMFEERPFVGWGPGTYQFVYAPFQRSKERTIISTNAGDRGNAHSEYIGPLSEEGVLGMLTFLAIVIAVLYTGIRVAVRAKDKEVRLLSLVFILGLITYYVHGTLNNFLTYDKASIPFWGFTAIIVALDLYYKNTESIEKADDVKEEPPA
ncbi:MAG: O-antigen ligase family protein [Bacteroidales bacterium]|nr:O-antigen ligase family protein [Bacteroidales bacterium]